MKVAEVEPRPYGFYRRRACLVCGRRLSSREYVVPGRSTDGDEFEAWLDALPFDTDVNLSDLRRKFEAGMDLDEAQG